MIAFAGVCVGIGLCATYFVYVWQITGRGSTVITPFLLFSVLEMFLNWPAGLVAPVVDGTENFYALTLMLAGFAAFLTGALIGSGLVHHRKDAPIEYRSDAIRASHPSAYVVSSMALCAVVLGSSLLLYRGVPPLVESMRSLLGGSDAFASAVSLGESRRLLTKDYYFGGQYRGQGLLRQVLRVGWPFLTAISITLYLKNRRKAWACLAVIWFVLTFVFVAGEGTRAPFLFSVVFLVILVSLIRPLKYRAILAAFAASIGVMVALSLMSTKLQWAIEHDNAIALVGENITNRIVYGNGNNTVSIVDLVRDGRWKYRHGEVHFQRLLNAIPGVQSGTPLSNQLYQELNPHGNSTTYSSATYFGDVFLDFGPIGVVITYLCLGIFISYVQKWLFALRRTVLSLPAVAYLIFAAGFIPLTGIVGFFAVMPVVAFIYLVPVLTIKLLPKRSRAHAHYSGMRAHPL